MFMTISTNEPALDQMQKEFLWAGAYHSLSAMREQALAEAQVKSQDSGPYS